MSSRLDVYKALLAAQEATDLSSLDLESQRLIDKLILERTRFGLNLEENQRLKFSQLQKEISNLAVDFSKNMNEETGKVWFTVQVSHLNLIIKSESNWFTSQLINRN